MRKTLIRSEESIHEAVATELRRAGVFFIHPPNESPSNARWWQKMRRLGAMAGASDLVIFDTPPKFPTHKGAALELKRKGGKPTHAQEMFLQAMSSRGYLIGLRDSYEEAIELLKLWGYLC